MDFPFFQFDNKISFSLEKELVNARIETFRLIIHTYKDDEFEDCVALYGEPKLTKYFDYGKPLSRGEVRNLVTEKSYDYLQKNQPFGLFSIFLKESSDFIGQVDLVPTGEPGVVEIGCILHRKYHNQQFALESTNALLFDYSRELNRRGYKINDYPFVKGIATAHPKNYASQKLIKSLGMSFEKSQERFGSPRFWYSCNINTSIAKKENLGA